MTVRILQGDCRALLKTLSDASVHSIVTDPPYELGFMGKGWDRSGIAYDVEVWRECLRVLKPGGYLLAFGGTRTSHRMVCAIEDAGFEVRDTILWLYGSGFPKSLDVSKAIDKAAGAEREIIGKRLKAGMGSDTTFAQDAWTQANRGTVELDITAPATDAAKQWQGWGTALKPAHEPICVARTPLVGTVAANVQQHGTGALNIDGCRIAGLKGVPSSLSDAGSLGWSTGGDMERKAKQNGRWPANVVHDGSEEVLAAFPDAPGQIATAATGGDRRKTQNAYGEMARGSNGAEPRLEIETSAARFFYCAKASREDRNVGCDDLESKPLNWSSGEQSPGTFQSPNTDRSVRNHHPTVKPTELMRWLVRLVTPPGGTVLDPFAGSGSTGRAADIEGFNAILIELNPEYAEIARRRINGDSPLFAETA